METFLEFFRKLVLTILCYEIIATERYVSGYDCKGSESTGVLVHLFNDLANASDDASGATAKSLCAKLLMHTIKRDISAAEASFELSCIPLFRCYHQFQSVNMSGSRIFDKTGAIFTKSTPLDKYLARPGGDQTSWYEFVTVVKFLLSLVPLLEQHGHCKKISVEL